MMRKNFWLVFAAVFIWKIALFVFTAQPVPANDAFFYDGAVIHHLLHGGFYNPCVAQAFPISGTKIFSAYPPLYQVPLLGWMKIFGTSAISAMGLHLVLFGLYLLVLLAIFRRLQTPAWCVNLAGFFLLTFTFHDRPDSFAHLLGVLALYACVRSRRIFGRGDSKSPMLWTWLMVLFDVLAFCTSLQIGGIYLLVVSIATIAACRADNEPIPFLPMSLMALVPAALVVLVIFGLPTAWAGFMENVRQTPFLTGLRMPQWQEAAKIVRTVPGVLLVTIFSLWSWMRKPGELTTVLRNRYGIILLAALLPALGILAASLTIIAPNTVAISNYLQPIVVASYLALVVSVPITQPQLRFQIICLIPAILLSSIRAIGMTTWGVACYADVSYSAANERVREEVANHPSGYKIVISSALAYGVANHDEIVFIHSDWLTRAHGDSRITDTQGLLTLKPEKIILTQFDYYRRFQAVLEGLKGNPKLEKIQVINTANTRPPDSIQSMKQVIQHVSWAPVIVNLTWRE